MPWSEETNAALRSWLEPETWFRRHSADQRRFYVFIAHVWNERRTVWNHGTARETILSVALEMHPDWDKDQLKDRLLMFYDDGALLLEFLACLAEYGSFAVPAPQLSAK